MEDKKQLNELELIELRKEIQLLKWEKEVLQMKLDRKERLLEVIRGVSSNKSKTPKMFEFKDLGDEDIKINILNKEIDKIIESSLEDESKVHNLNNFEKGLVSVGIIKGLAYVGIFCNPFYAMDVVSKIKNNGGLK